MAVKKSLGRGLGALLSESDDYLEAFEAREQTNISGNPNKEPQPAATGSASKILESGHIEIPLEQILRNENQPRKNFDEAAMTELINSIRVHGVITPIIVVKIGFANISAGGDKYMIIAGERRWRAAAAAGLKTIPAIVRNYTARQVKEISLIDNIQREDLNPVETAQAIKQLMQEYSYTQEQVADRIGKSRSAVANTLGLLTLDNRVIELISSGRLSAGHAKVLTAVDDNDLQLELALKGADGRMTVRKFEDLVRSRKNGSQTAEKRAEISLELRDLVSRMQRVFATKISAIGNDNKGRIYIDYYTRDDLDRIFYFIKSAEQKN